MPSLETLPRYKLATLPTPLDELPRLSKELGVRVLMKRDDLTGFALGGNKARKLEYLLADALAQNADTLLTGGGPQSNHARITAAAARKVGLACTLVLSGVPPADVNGNLLLDHLLGADIEFADPNDPRDADVMIAETATRLNAQGRRAYAIPIGGSNVLGCIAYARAMGELVEQLSAERITPDAMFVTTGSCGTHAGILAGLKYYGVPIPLHGVTVSRAAAACAERVASLVGATGEFIERTLPLAPGDVIVHDGYVGPGYAQITPGAREAMQMLAQLEGIILDPVYTGKTMAGLIDLVRRGEVARGATIVFWHTGGAPGMFGYAKDVVG
ncbi:MAG: D-cysteine desulfhydrase family protein [Chloroflexi bacterium]|nr:D-cysteine desulfhydrase family protein [Chloroflexota bacterium]